MISQKKNTGRDSINWDDSEEYIRMRLKEDFNSIQLIACSRLSRFVNFVDPTVISEPGTGYLADCNRPNHPDRLAPHQLGFKNYMNDLCILVVIVTLLDCFKNYDTF